MLRKYQQLIETATAVHLKSEKVIMLVNRKWTLWRSYFFPKFPSDDSVILQRLSSPKVFLENLYNSYKLARLQNCVIDNTSFNEPLSDVSFALNLHYRHGGESLWFNGFEANKSDLRIEKPKILIVNFLL